MTDESGILKQQLKLETLRRRGLEADIELLRPVIVLATEAVSHYRIGARGSFPNVMNQLGAAIDALPASGGRDE